MPTTVQFRRGTTAQNNAFTGAVGEITIDTDKDTQSLFMMVLPKVVFH